MTQRLALPVAFILSCANAISAPAAETPASALPISAPEVDAGVATLAPVVQVADAGSFASARNVPTVALLRDFVDGRESALGLVDPDEGFAFIEVGPNHNPGTANATHLNAAKKWCGPKAVGDAVRVVRAALVNWHSEDALSCKDLSCVHEAAGEWDSEVRGEFARKDGRLVLLSYVEILDVPMRQDASTDRNWARQQMKNLAKQSCTRH